MKLLVDRVRYREKPCPEAFKQNGKWFVELNSLDDLQSFIARHGDVIINESTSGPLFITIYDGRVED